MATKSPRAGAGLERALRLQLGHDLHDGPLQLVVGAKMLAESLSARVAQSSPSTTQPNLVGELERLAKLLGQAIADTRDLVQELRPWVDPTETWVDALKLWFDRLPKHQSPDLVWKLSTNAEYLSPHLAEAAYRLTREAVANAIKHAQAKTVRITAKLTASRVILAVQDDGRGFDPDDLPEGHFGVIGMRERAAAYGGKCEIESSSGQGTTVKFSLPRETI